MSFVPLPDDRVLEIQNSVFDLWDRVSKERNYDCVAGFLIEFKKAVIREYHIQGPQAYWFLLGMLAGSMHDRQLITTQIEALCERIRDPYVEDHL